MKYLIILADGMADELIPALGNKTPLQLAQTPTLDKIAALGRNGLIDTIPSGYSPGSEIANLVVLGYDIDEVFEGRGVFEATSVGIAIEPRELVMRCNLISIENNLIKNYTANHIKNEEANELISYLQNKLGNETLHFYPANSYRNILKMKGGSKQIRCTAPHDAIGRSYLDVMIKPLISEAEGTATQLNNLILKSQKLLYSHPINVRRRANGQDGADSIWLWSAGHKPNIKPLSEIYGFRHGAVISAMDVIKGIGIYAGLEVLEVTGATGMYNTNYEAKAQTAIKALKTNDFVFLHLEAIDEAGHEGNVALKIDTIENFDSRLVKTIFDELSTWDEPVSIAILPDHATLCSTKTHSSEAVPFVIYTPEVEPDNVLVFDEISAKNGCFGQLRGNEFMKQFIVNHTQEKLTK